jgi:transposase
VRAAGRERAGSGESDDDESGIGTIAANAEKKTFHAAEQDTVEGGQARAAFQELIRQREGEPLLFVDETGSHIDLARPYAWAPRGQRAYAAKPRNRGRAVTMIGAMGIEGLVAMMSVEGGTDGDVFRSYVEQVLAPRLRPGHVVIMDNLKAHKVRGIREAIEAAHATLLYLPPYSPDLSPIELCWSKVKAALRARAARTRDALDLAWTDALASISASDAQHWFAHCGYRTAPN